MKIRFVFAFAAGAMLMAAMGLLWDRVGNDGASKPPMATMAEERQVLYWTDPMVPGYRSDKPGKSPFMDMELVPVYVDDLASATVIAIKPEIANSLGIRTEKIVRARPTQRIEAHGYLFAESGGWRVRVELFDRDADVVRVGQVAEVRVRARSGRALGGLVKRVEREVDVGLRSAKAIIAIDDRDAALESYLPAEVTVHASVGGARLLAPLSSLIHTGRRTAVVRALGEGRFEPVPVVAGNEVGDQVEIVRGVEEGDEVVTSGQFLIDSEASVRASFERMQGGGTQADEPMKARSKTDHRDHEVQP